MTKSKGKKPKLGEVYAIPMGELYGFARVYLDDTFGVYNVVSSKVERPKWLSTQKIAFWACCFDEPTRKGLWPRLGRIPFPSLDEAWPPPHYHFDLEDPLFFSIYHRNERRAGGLADIQNLEPGDIWSEAAIRARIQVQVIEQREWNVREHSQYYLELEREYGPNYEQVIAEQFREPSRDRRTYPPGTLIDAMDLNDYLDQLLKEKNSTAVVVEFMTAEAAARRDEIEGILDDRLVADDMGGVVGAGALSRPDLGDARCDLQLEVYNKRKALSIIGRALKQAGLELETRVIVVDDP